jgi:hypothetical protein
MRPRSALPQEAELEMMQMVLAGAGAAWSAAAIDSLVETILTPGPAIRMFGRSIAFTGPRAETIVLTLLGLSVGAILAVAGAWVGQTLRASSWRKELERRSEQRALEEAGLMAKNDLLTWRVEDLQRQADVLLVKRDELLDELSAVAARTTELRTKARRSRKTLERLSKELVVTPDLESLEDRS